MVTEPVNEPPPLTVLYDGTCPLCRREIGIYSDLKPNTLVCFVDVSDAALPPVTTREQLLAPFRVRSRVGVNRSPYDGRHEARSVIQGRPVRSLATNRKPAGGG